MDFWTLVLSLWSVSVSQCAGSSGLLTIQKRDQNPTLNREVLCAECVRAMKTNRQWRQARDEKVIAREDCYTYIAALRSPDLLRDSCCYLDRDTRRGPRTRVLAVITRRSAHCSLLRTHKPGSPLLPCLARTPVLLALVLTHCRLPS